MSFQAMTLANAVSLPMVPKTILKALANYCNEHGEFWPSYQTLANDVGCSRQTIITRVKYLEALGLIKKATRVRQNGSFTSNIYQFKVADWLEAEGYVPKVGKSGYITYVKPDRPSTAPELTGSQADGLAKTGVVKQIDWGSQGAVPLEPIIKPITKKQDINTMADSDESAELDFKKFWNAGLPKTKKIKARKTFKQLRKKKADRSAFTNMLVNDIQHRLQDNQFGFDRLHPTSYLSNERWTDEYAAKPLKLVETSFREKHTNPAWRDEILNRDEKEALQNEFKAMSAV